VDPYVSVRCNRALLPTYPAGRVLLSVLPLAMRMAGPREALWHAIIRKNHGATHFVVGRDHAGPGDDARGRPFYPTYAAQELVRLHAEEIGVGIATFPQMVYVHELEAYVPEDEVREGQHRMQISGTEQRRRLSQGAELPTWFTPPQVAAELRRAFPPRSARGVAVFLGPAVSGGPGAADAVVAGLREAGRTVTVLDESIPDAVDGSPALMAHLVGEVMRNGGAVVCVGPVAERLASAGTGLAGHGLVLDVRDGDGSRGVLDAVSFPHHEVLPLVVPRGASADLVGEVVVHHLRMSGYVAEGSVRADGAAPTVTH
jgi:sulfate adenylyltransferase